MYQHQPMYNYVVGPDGGVYEGRPPQLVLPKRKTSGLAIAAMVTSICGLVMSWPACIVGLILGNVAKNRIERGSGEDGYSMALTGVVVGWVGVGMMAFLGVLLFIAATGSATV